MQIQEVVMFAVLFLIAVIFQTLPTLAVHGGQVDLFPINEQGKYGYIDREGNIAISARFDSAGLFKEGFARVKVGELWGFVNAVGKLAIAPSYEHASDFREGAARVMRDRKFGFVDRNGRIIVPPIYSDAGKFSEGLARVKLAGEWRYVDKKGRQAFRADYDHVGDFSCGYAQVARHFPEKDTKVGFIDKKGQLLAKAWFRYAEPFSECIAVVSNSDSIITSIEPNGLSFDFFEANNDPNIINRFDVIDQTGSTVAEIAADTVERFANGLSPACRDRKCGYVDTQGNLVIPQIFDSANGFSENFAHVVKDGKSYLINNLGDIVLEIKGSMVRRVRSGIIEVIQCEGTGRACWHRYYGVDGQTIWAKPYMDKVPFPV